MTLIWHVEAWKADYSIDTVLLNHFHFNFRQDTIQLGPARPLSEHYSITHISDSDLNKKKSIFIIQINNGYSDSVHVINPNSFMNFITLILASFSRFPSR